MVFHSKSRRAAMQRHGVRLAVAGALALAAALSSHQWLAANAAAPPAAALRSVLVTARPLQAGTVIAPGDLRWHPWPAAAIDPGWLVHGSAGPNPLTGRVITARLAAGTPVSPDMTIDPATGSAFAASIRPGRRAITIAVTPAAGLAGFVAPGDSVDVLLTQAIGNRRTGQTLLTAVTVLGIDQRQRGQSGPSEAAADVVSDAIGSSGAEPPDLVTLEVSPRQAEFLAIAGDLGKLSLILRGPGADSSPRHGRSWDSDVTGLPAALLAAGDAPLAPAPATITAASSPAPAAPLPPARNNGVEVVYGLPSAPGPTK